MGTIGSQTFCILPYANALPLVHFLPEVDPAVRLIYRTPRSTVGALLEEEVDAAIIPVVDLFSHPGLVMVPGLGICADGDVTSVLLQCQRPLAQVKTIALDLESKTSNTLVQVLMRDHFCVSHAVAYVLHTHEADACVCIGDRALRAASAPETYDLAGQWKEMTGLPFVFAVWAVRESHPDIRGISQLLHRAKDLGRRSIGELARLAAERLALPEDRCHRYLADHLHYDVGPAELRGISRFQTLSAGLLEQEANRVIAVDSHPREEQTTPILRRN